VQALNPGVLEENEYAFKKTKKMNMKRIWIYGIVLFSIIFIAAAVIFGIFDVDILPSQFYGALIGVVITAIITVFLLQGQTANEEKRDIRIRVFEKKQEIYHAFLEELRIAAKRSHL
jgi:cadmium resistance protein CadD (predicted permease)